jgi:hypothetical protein
MVMEHAWLTVVVLGAKHAGKTSLVKAWEAKSMDEPQSSWEDFVSATPGVLPAAKLSVPNRGSLVVYDTNTSSADQEQRIWESQTGMIYTADLILIAVDSCGHETEKLDEARTYLERLQAIPALRSKSVLLLETKCDDGSLRGRASGRGQSQPAPPGVVARALDLEGDDSRAALALHKEFPQVEGVLRCSARTGQGLQELSAAVRTAALYPLRSLANAWGWQTDGLLSQPLVAVLREIFRQCSSSDGVLTDNDVSAFQTRVFKTPMQPEELQAIKGAIRARRERAPNARRAAFNAAGELLFEGFCTLVELLLGAKPGPAASATPPAQKVWQILWAFGCGQPRATLPF